MEKLIIIILLILGMCHISDGRKIYVLGFYTNLIALLIFLWYFCC